MHAAVIRARVVIGCAVVVVVVYVAVYRIVAV